MSQTALVELSARRGEENSRTGEALSNVRWAEVLDMGDASSQQMSIGGLDFAVLDYGGRLQIPLKLRTLLNEGNAFGGNQCSIIHLAAGVEWHLQKRPNRFPLKNRVISTAIELRIFEHYNACKMRGQFCNNESCTTERMAVEALVRDVLSANHDRDFRFWSLFCGKEIVDQNLRIRIVELNSHDARTRVYNFASEDWNGGEQEVLYILAYRWHMGFMKQSRLTNEVRWGKRGEEFTQIFDMQLLNLEDIGTLSDLVAGYESRQCRHCPESCQVRLQYPGVVNPQIAPCRMSGHTSKRHPRTDAQRKEYNDQWAKRYNELAQNSGGIELPGRSRSVPTDKKSSLENRTGVIKETDPRQDADRFGYQNSEQADLSTFFRPPVKLMGSDIQAGGTGPPAPVPPRTDVQPKSTPPRRASNIELPSGSSESEAVEMRLTYPKRGEETIDFAVRGSCSGTANYPIHDLEWRDGLIAHEETQRYYDTVTKLGDYSLQMLEEIVRLGNQMALVAGGYRLAARELQELNFRKRSHVADRIEATQHVFPAIASQLIDISRRGVIPEYRGCTA